MFELVQSPGKLPYHMATVRKRLEEQFAEADANDDGQVDVEELFRVPVLNLKQLFSQANQDHNETLSASELEAWLELQDRIASGHVLVTVLDYGSGLFELWDANRDGGLSRRELRSACQRAQEAGLLKKGRLDTSRLPRYVAVIASLGHPSSPLASVPVEAPNWFRAMDRNADGDISPREFLGSDEVFQKFDQDADGLLDLEELAASAAVPR